MAAKTPARSIPAAAQVHQLRFSRSAVKRLLDGIPQDKLCTQSGSCVNHALWIIGHLACSDDYFLKEFAPPAGSGLERALTLPEEWHKIFNMGSKPVADASQYPPFAEVKKAFDERHDAMMKWFESLTAAQLDQPTPEGWKPYAPTIGDLGHFAAWHEGYHAGQLAPLRKAFGLPAAFG